MEFKLEHLKYFLKKIFELRKKYVLPKNSFLDKFRNKYEEFIKPATTNNFKVNKR